MTVQPGVTYYIDPAVATGYIYQTGTGNPNFSSVELPNIGNPNPYDLYLWNGAAFVFDRTLAVKTPFDFADGGVNEFEVLGIDPGLGLDPDNTTAFITALTFESAGPFTGTMTPITTNFSAARAHLAHATRVRLARLWFNSPTAPPDFSATEEAGRRGDSGTSGVSFCSATVSRGRPAGPVNPAALLRDARLGSAPGEAGSCGTHLTDTVRPRADYTDHFEDGKAGLPAFYIDGIRPI
jgi:hypothetical protein